MPGAVSCGSGALGSCSLRLVRPRRESVSSLPAAATSAYPMRMHARPTEPNVRAAIGAGRIRIRSTVMPAPMPTAASFDSSARC